MNRRSFIQALGLAPFATLLGGGDAQAAFMMQRGLQASGRKQWDFRMNQLCEDSEYKKDGGFCACSDSCHKLETTFREFFWGHLSDTVGRPNLDEPLVTYTWTKNGQLWQDPHVIVNPKKFLEATPSTAYYMSRVRPDDPPVEKKTGGFYYRAGFFDFFPPHLSDEQIARFSYEELSAMWDAWYSTTVSFVPLVTV